MGSTKVTGSQSATAFGIGGQSPASPTWWGGDHTVMLDKSTELSSAMTSPNYRVEPFSFVESSYNTCVTGDIYSTLPGRVAGDIHSTMGTPVHEDQVFVVPLRGSETPITRAKLPGINSGSGTPEVRYELENSDAANVQEAAIRMYRILKQNRLAGEAGRALQDLISPDCVTTARTFNEGIQGPPDDQEELVGMDYILRDGIVNYLRDVARLSPPIPQQVVRFSGINYTAKVTPAPTGYETFGKKIFDCFFGLPLRPFQTAKPQATTLQILKDISGYIMPGSMTLLLGPPGSGKSSLLQVLAGRARIDRNTKLDGRVMYNDREASEVLLTLIIAYINGQLDKHMPFLTVHETLQFAGDCTQAMKTQDFTPQMRKFFAYALVEGQDPYLEYILQVLGLKSIEHQLVGAGQDGITENDRDRLTTAEIAMGSYSVMLYDQPCSRQESLATYDLVYTLRAISRIQQCSAVMSLVQLSPEVFDLFDRVILLGDGELLYQGPRQDVLHYFSHLGFQKPPHVDACDFLQEIAACEGHQYMEAGRSAPRLEDLVHAYKSSDLHKDVMRIVRSADVLHTFWVESEPNLGLSICKHPKNFKDPNRSSDSIEGVPEVVVAQLSSKVDHTQGIESTSRIQVGDVVTGISVPGLDMQYLAVGSSDDKRVRTSGVMKILANARGHVRLQVERRRNLDEDLYYDDEEDTDGLNAQQHYIQNWRESTRTLIARQLKVAYRLRILILLRLMQVVILGVCTGTIFFKLGGKPDLLDMNSIRGLGFAATMALLMINLVQLPLYMMQRPIFYKQRDQRFFRSSSYVLAHTVVSLPQSILEACVYSACLYFAASLSTKGNGIHFFQHMLVMCLVAFFGSSLVFLLSAIAPILEAANAMSGLLFSLILLFAGFVIFPSNMPRYWRWLLYVNPLHWANLLFCMIQYQSYKQPCSEFIHELYFCYTYPNDTVGSAYLKHFEMQTEGQWLWFSYLILVGWILVVNLLSYLAHKKLHFTSAAPSLPQQTMSKSQSMSNTAVPGPISSSCVDKAMDDPSISGISWTTMVKQGQEIVTTVGEDWEKEDLEFGSDQAETDVVEATPRQAWKASHIPVKPLTLSFYNLVYRIRDPRAVQERILLNGISGYAKPGTMLALMGSTKCGKTTLLSCLAGRVEKGELKGEILVNGFKLNAATFSRCCGFVERLDAHQPFLTVRESLEFSASLRLGDPSVTPEERHAHVRLITGLLNLSSVGNQLVGSLRDGTGRTFEIAKKLTIAVELAANPSILFLDEPTSGLDIVGARNIIHGIQTIAKTGRTIITTIQNPSSRMLSAFNSVIILKQGGEQAYFGPVEWNCSQLLEYISSIPKVPKYDQKQNPVTFVSDLLGEGIKRRQPLQNFAIIYENSPLAGLNAEELTRLRKQVKKNAPKPVESRFAAPYTRQAAMVFLRTQRFLYRNVSYTFGKVTGSVALGLVMGSLYYQIGQSNTYTLTSRSLFIYIQVVLIGVVTSTNVIPQIGTDRLAYFREKRAGMYAPIFYPVSWAVAEIPYVLLSTLVFVAIANGMAGIATDTVLHFVEYWLCLFVFTLSVTYFAMLLTIATSAPMVAAFAVSIITSIWIATSGVVVPKLRIPSSYTWLFWANPFQYVTNSLTSIGFYCDTNTPACLACVPKVPCPHCPCARLADLPAQTFAWDRLRYTRSLEYSRIPLDFAALAGMSTIFALLAFISFVAFKHNSKPVVH